MRKVCYVLGLIFVGVCIVNCKAKEPITKISGCGVKENFCDSLDDVPQNAVSDEGGQYCTCTLDRDCGWGTVLKGKDGKEVAASHCALLGENSDSCSRSEQCAWVNGRCTAKENFCSESAVATGCRSNQTVLFYCKTSSKNACVWQELVSPRELAIEDCQSHSTQSDCGSSSFCAWIF